MLVKIRIFTLIIIKNIYVHDSCLSNLPILRKLIFSKQHKNFLILHNFYYKLIQKPLLILYFHIPFILNKLSCDNP